MVVKIGSNVLTENNGLNLTAIRSITRQICRLIDTGLEVILVSSGCRPGGDSGVIRSHGVGRKESRSDQETG